MARRKQFKRYFGPINFTPMSGTESLFSIRESAVPELVLIAERFPSELTRALSSLGNFIRLTMRQAVAKGGPRGETWPELSKMHVYRRMDLLKAGYADPEGGQWVHGKRFSLKKRIGHTRLSDPKERMMERWKGRTSTLRGTTALKGRMINALRYEMRGKNLEVGALSPSAAAFLGAVQDGRRGSRGLFQFTGRQPVTPAMRRAFWAAGIPLKEATKFLEQPKRPLVDPVFRALSPVMARYLVDDVKKYLAQYGITLEGS